VFEIDRRTLGPEHTDTLNVMNNLGVLYAVEGKYSEAEPLYVHVLELWQRQLGPEHSRTLAVMSNLAVLRQGKGDFAGADQMARQVLDIRQRILGPEHADTLESLHILGRLYEAEGKYADAEPLYAKALESRRRVLGPKHTDTLASEIALAELRLDQRRSADADPLLREALGILRQTRPEDFQRYWAENLLGTALFQSGRPADAEPLLLAGYQGMEKNAGRVSALNREKLKKAAGSIAAFYDVSGKPQLAAEWEDKAGKKFAGRD